MPKVFDIITPASAFQPYLLEDTYLKGGMRVVPSAADMYKIPLATRKRGMLVATSDDGKLWILNDDQLVTFSEFTSGSGAGAMTGILPITVMINGEIKIEPYAVLPSGGVPGDVVSMGVDGLPSWKTLAVAGNTGIRQTGQYVTPLAISPGFSHDFQLDMSKTVLLLYLAVDAPGIKVEAFSDPTRTEQNPYTFVSVVGTLADQGISILPDKSTFNHRRYSLLANLEQPAALNVIYWRLTNQGTVAATPTLTFTYLILE